jgi:hypothetical protein
LTHPFKARRKRISKGTGGRGWENVLFTPEAHVNFYLRGARDILDKE